MFSRSFNISAPAFQNGIHDGPLQGDGAIDPSVLEFSRCERVARDLVDNRPVGGINVNRSSRFICAEPQVESKNGGALPRRFEIDRSPK
jgi:hypothetical protein